MPVLRCFWRSGHFNPCHTTRLEQESEMKRVIASIAAGACLLFLTAGAAFAASSLSKPTRPRQRDKKGHPLIHAPWAAQVRATRPRRRDHRSTRAGPRVRCTQETRTPNHSRIPILLLRSPSTTSHASKCRKRTDGRSMPGSARHRRRRKVRTADSDCCFPVRGRFLAGHAARVDAVVRECLAGRQCLS